MRPLFDTATPALRSLLVRQPPSTGKTNLAWRMAVGAAVARYSAATLGPDGTLDVIASDPQWRREIRRMSPRIRSRLDELLGAGVVRRLTVRADQLDHSRRGRRDGGTGRTTGDSGRH